MSFSEMSPNDKSSKNSNPQQVGGSQQTFTSPSTGRAVMDLGTNTFHLLIAEPDNQHFFNEIWHDYIPVKLGEGGINDGVIRSDAFARGIAAMEQFHKSIVEHGTTKISAIATSALRNAANGPEFVHEVKSRTGISIETIDGDTEARYIYQGVSASGCLQADNSLIVDIGGGSVEFILGNQQNIVWKQSFEIGAARLMDKFHQVDPITEELIQDLFDYLDSRLTDLFEVIAQYPAKCMIGSSGAFETFAELVELAKGHTFDLKHTRVYHFETKELINVTDCLIRSGHDERAATPGIIPVRVDMIVVASLITRYLMEKFNFSEVVMTAYSLKEGILAELFSQPE
jgi:exopolyphosphatase/guanosine-5'-triphosphate,3'-diphosphate pyrophosphatase